MGLEMESWISLFFEADIKFEQNGANNSVTHRRVTPHAEHGTVPRQCSTPYQTLALYLLKELEV